MLIARDKVQAAISEFKYRLEIVAWFVWISFVTLVARLIRGVEFIEVTFSRGALRGGSTPSWLFKLLAGVSGAVLFALMTVISTTLAFFSGVVGMRGRKYGALELLTSWSPLIIFIVLAPTLLSTFALYQLTQVVVFSLVCLSLNLLTGYAGLISLGHAAFVLLGCYTAGLVNMQYSGELSLVLLAILSGGVLAGVVGLFVGIPSFRIKGPYLGMVTLSFSVCLPYILRSSYLQPLTKGSNGIILSKVPVPSYFGGLTSTEFLFYLFSVLVIGIFLLTHYLLKNTQLGRAFFTLQASEELMVSIGYSPKRYKIIAFTLSSFLAGMAGGMLYYLVGFVNPASFSIFDSLAYFAAIALGGMGSLLGSALGGLVLAIQKDLSNYLSGLVNRGETLTWAVYGALLVSSMILMPRGIAGEVRKLVAWIFFRLPSRGDSSRRSQEEETENELFSNERWENDKNSN